MSTQLTKEADALICILYKQYREKRKSGASKLGAKSIGSSADIYENIKTKLNYKDIDDTCSELKNAGLLDCAYADNVVCDSFLTDEAIVYMENRFKNNIKGFLEYLSKVKSIISI